MRHAADPRQMNLFEPASAMFSPMTIQFLSSDWPGLFRGQMLALMPADALGEHFSDRVGCHTKELYGMAGAIFLKEFFNLTIPQTVERYLTDAAWQYALNVNPMEASLSHATVERCQGPGHDRWRRGKRIVRRPRWLLEENVSAKLVMRMTTMSSSTYRRKSAKKMPLPPLWVMSVVSRIVLPQTQPYA